MSRLRYIFILLESELSIIIRKRRCR